RPKGLGTWEGILPPATNMSAPLREVWHKLPPPGPLPKMSYPQPRGARGEERGGMEEVSRPRLIGRRPTATTSPRAGPGLIPLLDKGPPHQASCAPNPGTATQGPDVLPIRQRVGRG